MYWHKFLFNFIIDRKRKKKREIGRPNGRQKHLSKKGILMKRRKPKTNMGGGKSCFVIFITKKVSLH